MTQRIDVRNLDAGSAHREIENHAALDALFRSDPFAGLLAATLEDWGGGWARVRYTPVEAHVSFLGATHGGATFSVADYAFGVASNSWGRMAMGLSMDVHFVAAPAGGEELLAESRERTRTHRTSSHLVEVTGEGGRPIASVHAMVFRTAAWLLGEEAWSPRWRATH
jgi:acyl-CoA thioesterase